MLLDVRKAIRDIRLDEFSSADIPADILKQYDLCFQALKNCINQSLVSEHFSDPLKLANISTVYKAKILLIKLTIDLSVLYLSCQRYTKDLFLISYLGMPIRF